MRQRQRKRGPADGPQHVVPAADGLCWREVLEESAPRAAAKQEPHQLDELRQPHRAPRVPGNYARQPLSEDRARTGRLVAEESAHLQVQTHRHPAAGQVGHVAAVARMHGAPTGRRRPDRACRRRVLA
jgi:hypothetical protein